MAELVLIYDSVTGGFISKQAGSTHIANAAITSALVASGAIGGAHLAAGAILSAQIASGAIGSSHLGFAMAAAGLASGDHASLVHTSGQIGANILATPHFANQGILSASLGANILGTPHIQNQGILSASLGAAVIGTPHLANQGILSASFGASVIAAPHIAAAGVLSGQIGSGQIGTFHFIDGVIVSSKVGVGVLGGAHLANAAILSAQIASGAMGQTHLGANAIQSGHVASGLQDLMLIAANRPRVELGQVVISGIWDGTPMAVAIRSGVVNAEIVCTMHPNWDLDRQLLFLQFNALSGGLYAYRRLELSVTYTAREVVLSGNYITIIGSGSAGLFRPHSWSTVQMLDGERPYVMSEHSAIASGPIASANLSLIKTFGYYHNTLTISGLTFWALSGQWNSGSIIKVLGDMV